VSDRDQSRPRPDRQQPGIVDNMAAMTVLDTALDRGLLGHGNIGHLLRRNI
jgi:hypothetical protein